MPKVYKCIITEKLKLTPSIYKITVNSPQMAKQSGVGQFLHVRCSGKQLLRRPISICNVVRDNVTIVFEVKGEGTKWLSEREVGVELDILGPLGNGFTVPKDKFIVVGGGIGTPPMLYVTALAEKHNVTAILGFRGANDVILKDEFEKTCDKVYMMTDDGTVGEKGIVTVPLEKLLQEGGFNAILSCGPHKMQEAIAKLAMKHNIPCQLSMEERMGCGVGACLVCACATALKGNNENIKMTRVCADGPVYDAKELVWQI